MGRDAWWSVPAVVLIGIPMYSNAAGIIPVVTALLAKGAALGTVLAFMMSVIALSLPEMIILRKVLSVKLIAIFIAVVGTGSRERRRSACPVSRRSFGRIVPSVATTESRLAIRRNPENEIASFRAFRPKNLAISNLARFQIDSRSMDWEILHGRQAISSPATSVRL